MSTTNSSVSIVLWIIGGICVTWFVWIMVVWSGNQSNYNTTVSQESVKNLLASKGLNVCDQNDLDLSGTPGLVSSKTLSVSTSCSDDVHPMNITLLQFSDEASRNAALQRAATTHRSGYGLHSVYAYGPYVLTVQGTQSLANQALLSEAMSNTNKS